MEPQPVALQVTTRYLNGHQVIALIGEIDICTAPAMHAYLLEAGSGTRNNGRDLVVDLNAVTFMDASGLTVLLRADRRARSAGGQLRLAAPTERITLLLAITQLDLHFDLYPTCEAATVPGSVTPLEGATSLPGRAPHVRCRPTAVP